MCSSQVTGGAGTRIGAIFEVGVLPDSSLLAWSGGQAVLQPKDDQARQPKQLQGVLDEGLDEDVGHEEGGGLRC